MDLSPILPEGFNAAEVTSLSQLPPELLGGAAAVLVAAVWVGHAATRGAAAPVRTGLLGLRAALAAALFLLLLEPGLRLMATSREQNRVVIAVDTSGSMAEGFDASGGALPADVPVDVAAAAPVAVATDSRARRAAQAAQALIEDIGDRDEPWAPEVWLFDEDWRPAGPEDLRLLASGERLPEGRQSKLSLVPTSVPVGEGQRPLGGVVLLSDGADTAGLLAPLPAELVASVSRLGAPLHTVLVGEPASFKDIALSGAMNDEFAFVRNKLVVNVTVRHKGFAGRTIPLTLKEDGRPVAQAEVTLPADGAGDEVKTSFTYEPQRAGKRIYTVSTPVLPEEVVPENNRVDLTLKLIRDRIRVLQVAGRPSWDQRFVRRLLKENPSVDLISFFILRSVTDVANASNRELSLIPFPTRELFTEQLGTFDVVIFQDFNYRPYQMGMYLENVKRFVEESGGGFMMLGGDLSFSEGDYADTPIADVLPVRLLPGTGHLSTDAFVPLVTEAGRSHPVTASGDAAGAEGAEGYSALPPLEGVNLVAGLEEGAETLLAHPFLNADGQAAPVVAVREVGKGRSLAVLTDSTWVWSLPHVGQGGRGDAHRRFFAHALRWLIRDPELSRVKIGVDLPDVARGVEPGTAVPLDVQTFNARYQPEGGDAVKIALTPLDAPDGTAPTLLEGKTGDDGTWRTTFTPPTAGAWRVRVEAMDPSGTSSIGADEDAFVVRATAAEKLYREPRADVLAALAGAGGGRLVNLARGDDITSLTFRDHGIEKVLRQRTEPLWNRAWVLGVLVVLAAVEWWWRRRRGFA